MMRQFRCHVGLYIIFFYYCTTILSHTRYCNRGILFSKRFHSKHKIICQQSYNWYSHNIISTRRTISGDLSDYSIKYPQYRLYNLDTNKESLLLDGFDVNKYANKIVIDEETQQISRALDLLDCLTTPLDPEHPEYDISKDMKRDTLLMDTDYETLKVELRTRELDTGGDKLEMMIRLLLNIIDPSVKYSELTGKEAELSYVSDEDISSKKARIIPVGERNKDLDSGPDADDLQALKRRRTIVSETNSIKDENGRDKGTIKARMDDREKIIMDGMVRKETSFGTCNVRRSDEVARVHDENLVIRSYVVGGRDVLGTWSKTFAVVILLPDQSGWRSKENRILADEIAYYHQCIVIVPDIYRGRTGPSALNFAEKHRDVVFDDTIASFSFAKNEYSFKGISLAGVGIGAKLALETACDLGDLSALYDLRMSDDSKSFGGKSASLGGSRHVNPYIVNQVKIKLDLPYEEPELIEEDQQRPEEVFDDSEEIATITENDVMDSSNKTEVDYASLDLDRTKKSGIRAQQRQLMTRFPSIPLKEIAQLCPLAVVAWNPLDVDVNLVGESLQIPVFIVTSGNNKDMKSKEFEESLRLHESLQKRSQDILDFSFRSYSTDNNNFVLNPKSDNDKKISHEAVLLGSYWLDIYSRYATNDYIDGAGRTKLIEPIAIINKRDIDSMVLLASPIASYLHEDGYLFLNERLPTDQEIQTLSV